MDGVTYNQIHTTEIQMKMARDSLNTNKQHVLHR